MKCCRILIINRVQFGYHMDTYYYCKYLMKHCDVTYLSFDVGKPKIHLDKINIHYVKYHGGKLQRFMRFIMACRKAMKQGYDVVFMVYFPGCSLLEVINPMTRCVMDIRTGSIQKNRIRRFCANVLLKYEARCFQHVTIISDSLARLIGLNPKRYHVLPLGADPIDGPPKAFDSLNLLYIGTLNKRRMIDTVKGFEKYYREQGEWTSISYRLIGDSSNNELEELRKYVEEHQLAHLITLPGYIPRDQLNHVVNECNVGVSYVPKTKYFDVQPVTKTFEYLMGGMPVIATSTYEHTQVINDTNGVLIEDSAEAFYKGLLNIFEKRKEFNSIQIKKETLKYSWQGIVEGNLMTYLSSLDKATQIKSNPCERNDATDVMLASRNQ